jgi:D-alanyl-D-alanine carboxypeptidase (penicillin-binding protein 5/6)
VSAADGIPDIPQLDASELALAIVVAVPAGSAARIKTQVSRPEPLVAPFTKGQTVGSLKIALGEQALAEIPLTALEAVEQAGVVGRAWDAIRLWIK